MSEGVAVARRVAATGVPVQIGYPRRFDAGFTAARDGGGERRTGLAAHRAFDDT
jgi:hypothetical protein